MGKEQDLTGKRFSKLVVQGKAENVNKEGRHYWVCLCDCGNTINVMPGNLRSGNTKSCGCAKKASHRCSRVSNRGCAKSTKTYLYKTWGEQSRIYRIWRNIKYRTSHTNKGIHHNYIDKQIKMCDEWRNSSESFIDWSMEHGYNDTLTIDRIDNDGDYSPENCRWVDMSVQNRNKENSVFLEYNGERRHLYEWAELYNINPHSLYDRIFRRHWDIGKALTSPVRKQKPYRT